MKYLIYITSLLKNTYLHLSVLALTHCTDQLNGQSDNGGGGYNPDIIRHAVHSCPVPHRLYHAQLVVT